MCSGKAVDFDPEQGDEDRGHEAREKHRQDVVRAVERRDLTGRAGKQLFKAACADAEQGLMRETQFRFRDEFEIHELLQRGVMRRANILD